MSLLRLFSTRAPVFLAVGVFLGLAFPSLAHTAAPALAPAVVWLLGLALVRLRIPDLLARLRRPWLVAALVAWQLVGSAGTVWLATWPLASLGLSDGLRTALVVLAAASPIMSSITLALLFRLDAVLVSVVVFVSTLLVPFTIGPVGAFLAGEAGRLDALTMMWRMAALVGAGLLIASVLRAARSRAWIDAHGAEIDGLAVVLLLVVAVSVMDQAAVTLREASGLFFTVLGASLVLNVVLQALSWALFRPAGRAAAVAAALPAGNRNAGLALAGLPATAPIEVGLIFALSQIPIYVLPILLGPVYRRLADRPAASQPEPGRPPDGP